MSLRCRIHRPSAFAAMAISLMEGVVTFFSLPPSAIATFLARWRTAFFRLFRQLHFSVSRFSNQTELTTFFRRFKWPSPSSSFSIKREDAHQLLALRSTLNPLEHVGNHRRGTLVDGQSGRVHHSPAVALLQVDDHLLIRCLAVLCKSIDKSSNYYYSSYLPLWSKKTGDCNR